MPVSVLGATCVGAVALVAGKVSRKNLARCGGLIRGEVEELNDAGAIDGIVDGLPCLKVAERRLAGVEEGILDTQLEAEVDAGRVPDCEMPIIPVERCQVSPARDDVRFLRALAFHDYV